MQKRNKQPIWDMLSASVCALHIVFLFLFYLFSSCSHKLNSLQIITEMCNGICFDIMCSTLFARTLSNCDALKYRAIYLVKSFVFARDTNIDVNGIQKSLLCHTNYVCLSECSVHGAKYYFYVTFRGNVYIFLYCKHFVAKLFVLVMCVDRERDIYLRHWRIRTM